MTLPKPIETHPMTAQWVAFGEDRRATVFSGRVELGQGVSAALVRIAATELGLGEDRIDLVAGDTERVPNEGSTVGSLSIQIGGMALRHAASAARWECLTRAAALLQTAPERLEVRQGAIVKDGLETGLTYWTLTAETPLAGRVADFARPLAPEDRAVPAPRFRRADMIGRLRGEVFIHDLAFPDMLHGRIVHPPFGATGLATSSERLAELAGDVGLFRDGQVIGVTAENEHAVIAAAERLRKGLAWQVPTFGDPIDALRSGGKPQMVADEGALPDAPPSARVAVTRPCIAHASIGACCALARFDRDTVQVWSHSQGVFALRGSLAKVLNLTENAVNVRHVPGAGCYGHNGADDVALDAALLARANPGRHVRVIWARADEFQSGPLSPAMKTEARAWLSPTGSIDAMGITVVSPGHSTRPLGPDGPNLRAAAYLSAPTPILDAKDAPVAAGGGSERNATPPYATRATRVVKHAVTDIPYRASALRGLGAQVNVAAIEGLMDDLAACAGQDPIAFRLAHLPDPRARAVVECVRDMAGGLDASDGRARGAGFARYKNISGYCACIVEVGIGETIRPFRVWAAADVGEVIDLSGTRNQLEGGLVQSLSIALYEAVVFESGRNTTRRWDDYPVVGFGDVPDIEIEVLPRPSEPPLGCGEIATGPATAAVLNAATRGLGIRPSMLPLTRDNLVKLLSA